MQISLARTVNITALQLIIEAQYVNAAVLDDQQQPATNAVPDLPAFMGHFFGDDDQIRLSIDLDTGRVQGWVSPTAAQLQAFAFPELEVINPEPVAVAVLDDYGMSWGVYSEGEPIATPSRLAAEELAQSMREQNPARKHLIYAAPWREVAPVSLPLEPAVPESAPTLTEQKSETRWGVFIDNGCGTCAPAPSLELANAYCEVLQKVRPDYVGIISVKQWPENEVHNTDWFDESYQSCLKSIEKMQKDQADAVPDAVPDPVPAPIAPTSAQIDIEDAIAAAGTTEDTAPRQPISLSTAQQFERDLKRLDCNEDISINLFKCFEEMGLAIGTKPLSLNNQGEVKGFCVCLTHEGQNFLTQLKSCTQVEADELVAARCLPNELDYQLLNDVICAAQTILGLDALHPLIGKIKLSDRHMADGLYDLLSSRRAYITSHCAKQVVDTSVIEAPAVALREEVATEDLSKDVIFTVRETGKSHVAEYLGHQKRSLSNSHSPTYSAINLLAQSLGLGDVVMITAISSQVAGALGIRKYKIDNSLTKDKLAVYVRHDGRRYTARTLGFTGRNATSVSSERAALENLMVKLGIAVDTLEVVETTDDAMREQSQTRYAVTVPQGWTPPSIEPELEPQDSVPSKAAPLANTKTIDSISMFSALFYASHQEPIDPDHRAVILSANLIDQKGGLTERGQELLDQLNAPSLSDDRAEELVSIALAYRPPAAATYAELVQVINHCQTVNQVSALVNRINQHTPSTERQALYTLQNARIEALKANSAA